MAGIGDGPADAGKMTISVIMPNYNYERYIGTAIESLQNQQGFDDLGFDLQIIVVDDGSTDNSWQKLEQMRSADPRIEVYRNERKKGESGTRNTGLSHARGDWFIYLDSDDLLSPRALSSLCQVIRDNPGCRFVAGDIQKVDPDGAAIDVPLFWPDNDVRKALESRMQNGVAVIPDAVSFFFAVRFLVVMGNGLLHKDLVARAQTFDENLTHAVDTDYNTRAALGESLYFIEEPILMYRQHSASVSRNTERRVEGTLEFISDMRDDPSFSPYLDVSRDYYIRALDAAIYYHRETKNFARARQLAFRGIAAAPGRMRSWKLALASCLRQP